MSSVAAPPDGATASPGPPHAEPPAASSRRAAIVASILVAAPFVIAIVSLLGRHWYPAGDQAVEVLRIRDVFTGHTPLLGAWSRWGWAHPGPWLFWFLAPFDRLLGTTGVLAGVGLLNGAAAVGVVLVAQRRSGGRLAVLAALMVSLLTNSLGLGLLLDPWNPWAAFLPFVLFLFLAWSVWCDDIVLLPLAVAVGSFVVQAHVGFAPMVLVLLVTSTAVAAVHAVRAGDAAARRWFVVAGVVGLVLWLPPIVQQLTGDPRNVSDLVSYARHPTEPAAGWTIALDTLGLQLQPLGPWLTNSEVNSLGFEDTAPVLPALIVLGGAAVCGWWARRRGQRDAARLVVVALITTGVGVFATARVTGIVVPYVFRWWWGIAALIFLSIVWCLVATVTATRVRTVISAVAFSALAALTVVQVAHWPAPLPEPSLSRALAGVKDGTIAALDPNQRYLIRSFDARTWEGTTSGMFALLDARGFDVFIDPSPLGGLTYGNWRLATSDQVDAIVTVVGIPEFDDGWQPPPGSRAIASYDPLTPEQRARARTLEASIKADMGASAPRRVLLDSPWSRDVAVLSGASRAEVDDLHKLQRVGDGFVVFVSPATAA